MTAAGGGVPGSAATVVVYVLSSFPHGTGEPFVRPELEWLQRHGAQVVIVPVRPRGNRRPVDDLPPGATVLSRLVASPPVLAGALRQLVRRPAASLRAVAGTIRGAGMRAGVRNLAVAPKALWLAGCLPRLGATHVHAYWASTPATVAMAAASLTGVPWSFTGHRWDLVEPNTLEAKVASAAFARITSAEGLRRALAHLPGPAAANVFLAHTPVEVPAAPAAPDRRLGTLVLLCPALLIERKDHATLLRGVAGAVDRGADVELLLAGSGPLRDDLLALTEALGLGARARFLGQVGRSALLRRYDHGEVDAVALTSLDEGLPFGLLEAMARGIPTIGTDVGGIGELLSMGGGLLVPPRDHEAVADAIHRLATDGAVRARLAGEARRTVQERFNGDVQTAALLERFRSG